MTSQPGTDRSIHIAPSILPANFASLGEEVTGLVAGGVDRIHWDVMDGVFVPNLTIGPDVIASLRPLVECPFEAHLMVVEPDRLMHRYVEAGCSVITVHAEACQHLHRTLGAIRELGARSAVALNPGTSLEAVRHVLDLCDMVLVMTVNPGFGGQSYLASMEPKIAQLRTWILEGGHDCDIEVDGGISANTAAAVTRAGANVLVAGSAMFTPAGFSKSAEAIRAAALAPLRTGA